MAGWAQHYYILPHYMPKSQITWLEKMIIRSCLINRARCPRLDSDISCIQSLVPVVRPLARNLTTYHPLPSGACLSLLCIGQPVNHYLVCCIKPPDNAFGELLTLLFKRSEVCICIILLEIHFMYDIFRNESVLMLHLKVRLVCLEL